VADATGTTVWRWDQTEPFGVYAPDENPSGLGVFESDLRLPGQVWNKETQTSYNYFRDCYDPTTGRYCQSDPIGLRGGPNTYAYVASMPLSWSDPFGLVNGGGGFSTRYGNWCGKSWSGGRQGRIIPQNPAGPIDSVDECCMAHDYCYAAVEGCKTCSQQDDSPQKLSCDRTLVSCLSSLSGKAPQAWPRPPSLDQNPEDAYFFCQKAKRYFQLKLGQ